MAAHPNIKLETSKVWGPLHPPHILPQTPCCPGPCATTLARLILSGPEAARAESLSKDTPSLAGLSPQCGPKHQSEDLLGVVSFYFVKSRKTIKITF